MAWFKSIQDIHHKMLQKDCRLALQVEVTAPPRPFRTEHRPFLTAKKPIFTKIVGEPQSEGFKLCFAALAASFTGYKGRP